jgi:predicted nucleic acid-binding protein
VSDTQQRARGVLDTSVVIDLTGIDPVHLPVASAISATTLVELAAGPHATPDPEQRAIRQMKLQSVESSIETLPFDSAAARAFGRLYAQAAASGRKTRGRRTADLLIAATALSAELPLYTRNPADFAGLENLVEIITV